MPTHVELEISGDGKVINVSSFELWKQAGGGTSDYDRGRYRELLIEHGHLIPLVPGETVKPLACGWPGPMREEETNDD